jgi:hypothetical protein
MLVGLEAHCPVTWGYQLLMYCDSRFARTSASGLSSNWKLSVPEISLAVGVGARDMGALGKV